MSRCVIFFACASVILFNEFASRVGSFFGATFFRPGVQWPGRRRPQARRFSQSMRRVLHPQRQRPQSRHQTKLSHSMTAARRLTVSSPSNPRPRLKLAFRTNSMRMASRTPRQRVRGVQKRRPQWRRSPSKKTVSQTLQSHDTPNDCAYKGSHSTGTCS